MTFDSDAPVFLTAPQEIALWRGKGRDAYLDECETAQMRTRIQYRQLTHTVAPAERREAPPSWPLRCEALP